MKFSKYLICFCMIFCLNSTYLCATETENTNDTKINDEQNVENIELEEQKNKLKKEVSNLVENLRTGIVSIDEKIEVLRKTDEYINYPTIRLNIDTPIFGIKSIINQKLRITKDVSPADVAKGYSIRDIVKNKVIKIPDLKVGNIVVSTKEFNIDHELTITEYNSLILKLMNYIDKVESVQNFLDIQTNKMFKEYISKEKKDKLSDLNSRLEKINNDLLNKNSDLQKIYFVGYEKYDELEDKYIKIVGKQKQLGNKSSDVLIDSTSLNNLQKDMLTLEAEVIDYLSEIEEVSSKNSKKIDIKDIYLVLYSEIQNKVLNINEYITKSEKIEQEKEVEQEQANEYIEELEQNIGSDTFAKDDKTTKITTLYEIYSNRAVDNMKNIISNIEKKMTELEIRYKEDEEVVENSQNTENIGNDSEEKIEFGYEKLTEEQINEEFNHVLSKYNEFLKYEYSFYLDNVNGLLELTNTKVKNIALVTDSDIISEVKYIYIDLPVNLDKYLEAYNVNSKIEIKYLISNFKNELQKLSKNYMSLMDLYNKLNVDELLNKA